MSIDVSDIARTAFWSCVDAGLNPPYLVWSDFGNEPPTREPGADSDFAAYDSAVEAAKILSPADRAELVSRALSAIIEYGRDQCRCEQ